MRDRRRAVAGAAGPVLDRRRVLASVAAVVALPPVLAACSPGTDRRADASEALLAMADAARRDAALAAAAVTSDPALAGRLEPLRAARLEHAAALDQAGGRPPGSAPVPATPPSADVAAVRDSVDGSARTAGEVVIEASALQAGLVAEVAACCAAYVVALQ
ncbi:hypothetical protein [Pseudonocardia kongjuensis]|uniref:hypothetical protein n=1 Tax=Pseudonocardia kongjuensis TaxID=102227 RepID=UPI0031D417EA